MSHRSITIRQAAPLVALACVLPLLLGGVPTVAALPTSSNVAFVGKPGDELSINGGGLHTSAFEFTQFSFSYIAPATLTSVTALAGIDTVILNMASSSLQCTSSSLSATTKIALNQFVEQGGKLVMYDSECAAIDYSWLDFPFTTNNPGANGASAPVAIVEENALSCSNPNQSCFIDVNQLATLDAVGDSNVITTRDTRWCADMQATNSNSAAGYPHAYAMNQKGIYIYDGFDLDSAGTVPGTADSGSNLDKLLLLELELAWNPSSLPCSVLVACPFLPPHANIDLTTPALGYDYVDGVAYAQAPAQPVPRVLGALDVVVTAAPGDVSAVSIAIDGTTMGSFAAPPYQVHWTPGPAPEGLHEIKVTFTEATPPACTHTLDRFFLVPRFAVSGRATGVWVGSTAPVSNEVANDGAAVPSDAAGAQETRTADELLAAPISGEVVALQDDAASSVGGTAWDVRATAQTGHVSLLAGLVTADAVHADAHVVYDNATGLGSVTPATQFVNLRVAGTPLGADVPPNTVLHYSNLGASVTVGLNEVASTFGPAGARATVNGIHVVLEQNGLRYEAIVAQASASAMRLPAGSDAPRVIADTQNDAGLGGDAPDRFAAAAPLAMQSPDGSGHLLFAGRIATTNDVDAYAVQVHRGQEVVARFVASPETAQRVGQIRGPPVDPGDTGASIRNVPVLNVDLLEPGSGIVRDSTADYIGGASVGLDVDVDGAWVLLVHGDGRRTGNYTVDLTVRDIPLLPGDGGTTGDAGSDCSSAMALPAPATAGVLQGNDFVDVYSLPAQTGDKLAASVKPGDDADGANFDLYVYGPHCDLLAQSHLGTGDGLPKGVPDAATVVPVVESGTYYVSVVRVNGIGSYALAAGAQHVIPAAPQNDALSGADAPSDCANAIEPPTDQGAYFGTIGDHDASDAIAFHVNAGDRVAFAVSAETLSGISVSFYGPGCAYLGTQDASLAPATLVLDPATVGGSYVVVVNHGTSGGNYAITVA